MKIVRRLILMAVLGALLGGAGGARAASIWTPLASGTSDTISAIVYQSPTRFWYATTNGKIEYFNGSGFVAGTSVSNMSGENFVDLAFQPTSTSGGPGTAGLYGYGVTSSGHLWQTTDGGVSWTKLPARTTKHDCSSGASSETVTELNAVVWANSQTVYLLGDNGTLQQSLAGNTSTPSFAEINKVGTGTCAAQGQSTPNNLNDAAFLPANPSDGFMVSQNFGRVYSTSDAFASGAPLAEVINAYTGDPRIALDAANPNRIWVVDHNAGGVDCGTLCFGYSTDGGNTFSNPTYPQTANGGTQPPIALFDVSSQGGTEVAAGTGGTVFTSIDGVNFYNQPADGALATENWRAEDAFDAQHAAVGGEGGALAVTARANTIPDLIAPTGSISGPATVTSGRAVRYTANVSDNPGGSGINPSGYTWSVPGFPDQHGASATYTFPPGTHSTTITLTFTDNAGHSATATLPVTVNDPTLPPPSGSHPSTYITGGATIIIYKIVTVTGRRGRYVPVNVSTKRARRFVVTILTRRGKHRVATAILTLAHGGKRTIHVRLSSNVKPGKYYVEVRVFMRNGPSVGRKLTIALTVV